jgi:hypothetical protein
MMQRCGIWIVAVVGLVSMWVRGDVATVPPDAGISDRAKTALNEANFSAEIAQKISDEVNKLVQNPSDKGTVAMVRQWLNSEDPPTATHPYQEAFSQALNQSFLNVLEQSNPPVNTKINFGLVIKDLNGPKMNLAPTAQKLLADKCQAVVFVGEQAVWAILPEALQNPNFKPVVRDGLLSAVIGGVKANSGPPLGGLIAEWAYRAINPKLWAGGTMPQGDNLSALVDCNLNLQKSRLDIYQNIGIPEFPKADTYASYLLLSGDVWGKMSNAQQLEAVQWAVNLVSLIGQRAAVPGQSTDQTRELTDALISEGSWLKVLAGILADPQMQAACDQIVNMQVGITPAAIKTACEAVVSQVLQNPAFSSLTPPPTIGSNPSSMPATEASK